jgi:hypothetical protein
MPPIIAHRGERLWSNGRVGADRDFVVALDVPVAQQEATADAVGAWLRTHGWSVPDPAASRLRFPAREPDLLGPTAGAGTSDDPGTIACGVSDGLWLALEDMRGPRCPACGTEVDGDQAFPGLFAWADGAPQPVFVCAGCGAEARAGDMDTEGSCTVGNPGVVIVPTVQTHAEVVTLARRLRDELRVAFGGRWVHVHQHK